MLLRNPKKTSFTPNKEPSVGRLVLRTAAVEPVQSKYRPLASQMVVGQFD